MNIEQEILNIEKLAENYRTKRIQRYIDGLLRDAFFKWQKAMQEFLLKYFGEEDKNYILIKQITINKSSYILSEFFDKFQPICTEMFFKMKNKNTAPLNQANNIINNKKVFIVHGHDEDMKTKVRDYVSSLGLEPIILSEQPGGAATIIEKFEENANSAAFAVILLSPCDQGKKTGTKKLSFRARQNVVFEFGYFVAHLKRERVVALLKDNVDRPTDISGILYTPFDENWQEKLKKEFSRVGLLIQPALEIEKNEPLNDSVKLVLDIISKSSNLSKEQIASQIGKSPSTVTRALTKLVKFGKIRRVGIGTNGHWEIIQ
ncbi:MAG: nucleotide-binding protein [Bacteroidales bacterium]|nr:nucleotide-binding protein [Bacteroidales bacterium]